MAHYYCFHNYVLDLLHYEIDVGPLLRQDFEDGSETTFVAFVFGIFVLVLLEGVIVFVYCIVGQMHVEIFQVVVGRAAVLLGAKPH